MKVCYSWNSGEWGGSTVGFCGRVAITVTIARRQVSCPDCLSIIDNLDKEASNG